jgi:hypothetical protein
MIALEWWGEARNERESPSSEIGGSYQRWLCQHSSMSSIVARLFTGSGSPKVKAETLVRVSLATARSVRRARLRLLIR